MTPQERLALALQYQKQRQELGSTLPDMNRAPTGAEPEQSWLDKLSEAASGAGYGLASQVEGIGQMVRHPLDTLHSMAVGAGKAMDNPAAAGRALVQGVKDTAGQAVSSPFNMGRAVGANVSLNPRKLAAMLESPMVREMTVYHGTPHQFPATEANPLGEFDASKIGTGEGAQAYGHGIYVAESPDVAKGYQQKLSDSQYILKSSGKSFKDAKSSGGFAPMMNEMRKNGRSDEDIANTLEKISERYSDQYGKTAKKIAEKLRSQSVVYKTGTLYHVDLPDEHIERMLDWDKPLSEQPSLVREAAMRYMNVGEKQLPEDMRVGQIGDKYVVLQDKPPLPGSTFGIGRSIIKGPKAASEQEAVDAYWNSLTGKDFYNTIKQDLGESADASDYMRQLGIPGIKYLDAGSRGQGGSGTRNFVIFPGEEKNLKILERK